MLVKKAPDLTYKDVTPKSLYMGRRNFLFGLAAAYGAVVGYKKLTRLLDGPATGSTPVKLKVPSASAVEVRCWVSSLMARVMRAPGTMAPSVSVTVPVMMPTAGGAGGGTGGDGCGSQETGFCIGGQLSFDSSDLFMRLPCSAV